MGRSLPESSETLGHAHAASAKEGREAGPFTFLLYSWDRYLERGLASLVNAYSLHNPHIHAHMLGC